MARYIDADALIRLVQIDALCNFGNFRKRDVIGCIKALPTADVVPKSEVEKLIIDRNAARLGMIAEHERLKMARSDVAREIFAEIERTLDNYHYSNLLVGEIYPISYYDAELEDAIAELKKKYTEGE